MTNLKREGSTFETASENLTYLLLKYRVIVANNPEKYAEGQVDPNEIVIIDALAENPRLLAPLIVLLTQHPIFLKKFNEIPLDIVDTVKKLRAGDLTGPDCRYERYRKLVLLCGV